MRIKSPIEFPNGDPCINIEQAERLEDERLSQLIDLGMPIEDHVRLTIKGNFFDPAFSDYTLELYGFWPEDLEPNRRDQRIGTPDYTLVRCPSKASGQVFKACYYFWLQRVRHGNEIVCELIWHPDVRDYLSARRNVWIRYADPAKALLSHVQEADLDTNTETQVPATKAASKRRGRPAGTGYFENCGTFLVALTDILRDAKPDMGEALALFRLSHHRLWRGKKKLDMHECRNRKKTLRNYLTDCGFEDWEDAKRQYCESNQGEKSQDKRKQTK